MRFALILLTAGLLAGCEMQVNHKHEIKPIKLEPVKIDFNVNWRKNKQNGHESGNGSETDNRSNMGAGSSGGPSKSLPNSGK